MLKDNTAMLALVIPALIVILIGGAMIVTLSKGITVQVEETTDEKYQAVRCDNCHTTRDCPMILLETNSFQSCSGETEPGEYIEEQYEFHCERQSREGWAFNCDIL